VKYFNERNITSQSLPHHLPSGNNGITPRNLDNTSVRNVPVQKFMWKQENTMSNNNIKTILTIFAC
jgi:hypothetical protein